MNEKKVVEFNPEPVVKKKRTYIKKAKKISRRKFTIWSLLTPPIIISFVSMYHLVTLFDIGDTFLLSCISAGSFEVLSIAALVALGQIKNKLSIWVAIILLFLLQALGNVYYIFINIELTHVENMANLFNIEPTMAVNRIIALSLGIIFPAASLTFIKMLSNYWEGK